VIEAFEILFTASFWVAAIRIASPLIFATMGELICERAGVLNLGIEGIMVVGAFAGWLTVYMAGDLWFGVAVAALAGAAFGLLHATLTVPLGLSQHVVGIGITLLATSLTYFTYRIVLPEVTSPPRIEPFQPLPVLLNFIMLLFVSMLLEGVLKDPVGLGWPQSQRVVAEARLPRLVQGWRLHAGFLIAVLAAVAVWVVMKKTTLGYEMRAVGQNAEAARFAGIPVNGVLMKTALLSGGLAALAGFSEVAGLKGNLTLDLSPGFGYTGIVVAMLAMLNPLGVVLAAIFVAGIFVGADAMSRTAGVPSYIAEVMVATALLTMVVAIMLTRFRVRWR